MNRHDQKRPDQKLRCTKEPYIEDVGPRKIKSIHFSKFSGDEIKKHAEVQVWSGKLYDPQRRPVENALLDLRMGVANKRCSYACTTCHGNFDDCPGHFGYLHLALPVFNVGYFNLILNVLKCICKGCARILLEEKDRKEYLKKMRNPKAEILQKNAYMKKIRDKCKGPRCPHCGSINGIVKKARAQLAIVHDLAKTVDKSVEEYRTALSHTKDKSSYQFMPLLTPVRVLDLFKRMIDEDCEVLNLYDRPEKLIVTDIAVPPAAIRPSGFVDSGRSNEDSLTSILKNIINTNSILRLGLESGAPPYKWMECWNHLQTQVVEYVNSESPAVTDSKNRGIIQRLKGKQGRFRGNLSGKRVEFTGRTVISPDPNLKITEVAVPILMARILTYPERVSYHNIEKLRQCVLNGPSKYPGANFVSLPDGGRLDLKYKRKDAANELKYGYVVHRHLEDGDIVLFNRQPSLHRMSIMSHRARIMPWRTLRFNESVCNPYNADFDGDEMNMHVPQTEEARTEALMLMGVQNNLCTPKNGEILVASTQDFLTSSFLITRKDTFYDRASFSLMCTYMGDAMEHIDLPTPAMIKPVELWTGKQLFSVLVRPNASTRVFLNFTVEEKIYIKGKQAMCPNDGYVYFRNSELISGQLGKSTLGNGKKDGLFSVLLRDYNSHAAASCMNRLAKLSARWIGNHGFSIGIDDVQAGEHLNQESKMKMNAVFSKCDALQSRCDVDDLERTITGNLSEIRDITGKVCMQELHWRNSPKIMSQCGSKGSPINISQMIICVGQQTVGGCRALDGFINRTLPHFPTNLKIPAVKGFVANSFYTGLTATEFFFHTMGGREGLVDTAVKTAETGYMSRRLMKGLEDLSVYYDLTVRNASGGVVQFLYGDDGMDPAKMEGNEGIPLDLDQLFMKVKATCPHKGMCILSPSEILQIVDERFLKNDMSPEGGCSAAFKASLLKFFQNLVNSSVKTRNALQLDENLTVKSDDVLERVAARISGISRRQIQVFLETCISRYHSKKVEAGSAIGAIGAQSIGEPGTQMTLKTFHFAGVASMNVTLGVPRIKEIINAAKTISRPLIDVVLKPKRDEQAAKMVKAAIEKTVLSKVVRSMKIEEQSYITVILDTSHTGISSESVRQSILLHPKIKLKPEHVRVLGDREMRVYPAGEDIYAHLFNLHKLKAILPKVIVKGIPTAELVETSKDSSVPEGNVFKVYVQGTNLLAVMGTPGVDGTKTKSNHIIEVMRTIGIEAARQSIIDEIQLNMKNYNMTIDIRHMMLLADLMTYKGEVLGITRFGISKMKDSVLMLASFEKTSEHLFNASFNGREDQIEGVSECIIMGIPMQLGTGILKVRQRVEELPEFTYGPDPILKG